MELQMISVMPALVSAVCKSFAEIVPLRTLSIMILIVASVIPVEGSRTLLLVEVSEHCEGIVGM
jgi:hypothetical protein